MTHRYLNILFILLLVSAVGVAVLSYFVWNDPRRYAAPSPGIVSTKTDRLRWYVDSCDLEGKKHKSQVRGWTVIDGQPYIKTQVYAELLDGKFRKLQTFNVRRAKVLKKLGISKKYRFPGFSAGHRSLGEEAYTGRIVIKVLTRKGEEFSVEHQCQV